MRHHKFLQGEHVPICDLNVASRLRLKLILLGGFGKDFVDEKLSVHILNLSVQNPHRSLIDEDTYGSLDHFLEPFSNKNVGVLVSIVEVIDDRTSAHILAVDVGDNF